MLFDLNARSRPILKWAGGKSGLLEDLVAHFPRHFGRYVEPFLGGAAVFLALREATPALLNDVNPELVNLYVVVRDAPHDLMAALDHLAERYSEAFYYELRATEPQNAIEKAARTIFLNKTGFNGLYRQNSQGLFNVPFGKRVRCPALYDRSNLLAVSRRLAPVTLVSNDFVKVLEQAGQGDFVYCDPPYEPLSPTSSFNAYHGSGFGRDEQRRLKEAAERAAARGAVVAVSNSSAPFILDLYADWKVSTLLARRAINSKGSARGAIAESLVLLDGRSRA